MSAAQSLLAHTQNEPQQPTQVKTIHIYSFPLAQAQLTSCLHVHSLVFWAKALIMKKHGERRLCDPLLWRAVTDMLPNTLEEICAPGVRINISSAKKNDI